MPEDRIDQKTGPLDRRLSRRAALGRMVGAVAAPVTVP
jgi:hypothetical protein